MLNERYPGASRWIIGVVTACTLIYLGVRHADAVVRGILWLNTLVAPLWIGGILALVLSLPMTAIERHLFAKRRGRRWNRIRRGWAIVLSILLVVSLFIGIAFLVLPELSGAIKLLIRNIMAAIDHAAMWEKNTDISQYPLGEYLSQINIDWLQLKASLEQWIKAHSGNLFTQTITALDSMIGFFISFFMSVAFSIYLLANKESLQHQLLRLVRVWLPQKWGGLLVHVSSVSVRCLRQFAAGQVTEALILGTLCTIGMLLLGIPYAPMIGAMMGTASLIPIAGAFLGTIIGAFLIMTVNPVQAIIFVVFILILQQIEGNLIYPRVVGSKIKLPPMWVLAAVTIGGNLAGALGMLLGVPTASIAYTLLKEATANRETNIKKSKQEDTNV